LKGYLLDENVPTCLTFKSSLPIHHARELGPSLSDTALWQLAQVSEYVIVTKDTDFSNRIMLANPPPWVVHLRVGNVKRRDFHAFLARVWPQVEGLLPAHKLINVYLDRIEAIR
jgi:predicted nuclease of predicted toxin-antitoxin system